MPYYTDWCEIKKNELFDDLAIHCQTIPNPVVRLMVIKALDNVLDTLDPNKFLNKYDQLHRKAMNIIRQYGGH